MSRQNTVHFRWLRSGLFLMLSCLFSSPIWPAEPPQIPVPPPDQTFSLTATPRMGDGAYYRVKRVDVVTDAKGNVTGRAESAGRFKRTVLYVNDDGSWIDRYTWGAFSYGRTETPGDSVIQKPVSAVESFSYDIATTDMSSAPSPEIGGLAKTRETFSFFTVVWDTALFFSAVTPHSYFPLHTIDAIGDRIEETKSRTPADFDFTPVVSNFAYTRRPLSVTFVGVSLVEQAPSALIRFEAGGNPLALDLSSNNMEIHLEGVEHITGNIYLGLDDHILLRGEMYSLLTATQNAVTPGRQVDTSVVVHQRVILERITQEAYENRQRGMTK